MLHTWLLEAIACHSRLHIVSVTIYRCQHICCKHQQYGLHLRRKRHPPAMSTISLWQVDISQTSLTASVAMRWLLCWFLLIYYRFFGWKTYRHHPCIKLHSQDMFQLQAFCTLWAIAWRKIVSSISHTPNHHIRSLIT